MTLSSTDSLIINEIFFSIQGESTRIGLPCVFVRLTACDLRCSWCDTTYAFQEGVTMSIDDILLQVEQYQCRLVEITGGEPLLQANVHQLMKHLCDAGYDVMLETGGHRAIGDVDPRVKRIMDIKCPGSLMEKRNHWENIDLLTSWDEVKFVLLDETDYVWAKDIISRYNLTGRCTVLLSPVFGRLENRTLAQWILRDHLPVQFQIQIHKYIWDPTTRGV
ncbi:MAG: radical SAM protein [Ignavibacteriae bacterium]|nr:MAG: radical SAM protein [Ignavibacteriota bacterium]